MRKFGGLPFMGSAASRAAEEEARKKAKGAKTEDDTEETDANAADDSADDDESDGGDDEGDDTADKDAAVRQQERNRCAAIITSAAAEGRMGLACHFAFKTNASAKNAIAGLEAAPKTEASAARGGLAAAMAKNGNPKLGVDGNKAVQQDRAAIDHRAIYGRMNKIGQH